MPPRKNAAVKQPTARKGKPQKVPKALKAPKSKAIKKMPKQPKKGLVAKKAAPKPAIGLKKNSVKAVLPQKLALSRAASKKEAVTPVVAKKAAKAAELETLYVLMLDKSGSMRGQSWQDLMNAVKEFLQTILADAKAAAKSRVTIITYDFNAYIKHDNVAPSLNLTKGLPEPMGGTNFDAALRQALANMQQHQENYKSIVLCMMTDGKSGFPEAAIKDIKKADLEEGVISYRKWQRNSVGSMSRLQLLSSLLMPSFPSLRERRKPELHFGTPNSSLWTKYSQ
ncbi:hypothetical protein FGO68_gene12262 [Halteria grandinella]|uniref:VWFA domain-containing protein n=1 Tax=Halteria grandinella TaxID=5974 RepID=A0A8J8T4U0_HALGN|nr:hypothetical protein FGO68_gene12262 [Halteria grandinella]